MLTSAVVIIACGKKSQGPSQMDLAKILAPTCPELVVGPQMRLFPQGCFKVRVEVYKALV